jgi:hypothetical protein
MSRLEYYSRPLVAFDPSNKEHRRFYHEFIINNTWGRCPVRFICPSEQGMDLVKMIQKQMVEYYVHQEFKNETKPKTRQKGRKILGLTNGGHGVILES